MLYFPLNSSGPIAVLGNLAQLPARCMHYLPHTFRILPHYLAKWQTMTKKIIRPLQSVSSYNSLSFCKVYLLNIRAYMHLAGNLVSFLTRELAYNPQRTAYFLSTLYIHLSFINCHNIARAAVSSQ